MWKPVGFSDVMLGQLLGSLPVKEAGQAVSEDSAVPWCPNSSEQLSKILLVESYFLSIHPVFSLPLCVFLPSVF